MAKAVPLLEAGARGSAEKRKNCFTCHNQALPVIALTTAQARGLAVDAENLRQQLDFTVAHLARNRANYLAGKGHGGQALTAGYALLTLEFGGWADGCSAASN
ncbi:MAG: D-aminoacylase, partial [Verrucomicrobiota bacterium]